MNTCEYEKWNKYTIGKVPFINHNYDHPHRQAFVDYVLNNDINSVIEIGPGELLEYQSINQVKHINYAVVDISDVFLHNCQQSCPEITTIKTSMEELTLDPMIHYDVLYAASVLEHTKNIKVALENIMKVARSFYFVMFKWRYDGNSDLVSNYNKKKKYWTTLFNIWALLEEIKKHGEIEHINMIMKQSGEVVDFEEYSQDKTSIHRTGDYLIIQGKCLST